MTTTMTTTTTEASIEEAVSLIGDAWSGFISRGGVVRFPTSLPGASSETRKLLASYAKALAKLDELAAQAKAVQADIAKVDGTLGPALLAEATGGAAVTDPRPQLRADLAAVNEKRTALHRAATAMATGEVLTAVVADRPRVRQAVADQRAKVAGEVASHLLAAQQAAAGLRGPEAYGAWADATVQPATPPTVTETPTERAIASALAVLEGEAK